MADGGEIRAVFKGAQEGMAQAAEDTAGKLADLGDDTMQKALDSVSAVENADGASTDAIRAIGKDAKGDLDDPSGADSGSSPESSGRSKIAQMLNGEGAGDSGAGSASSAKDSEEKPLPDWLRKRWEDGEQFNKDNHSRYPHNEVELATRKRVDSYRPGREIVERKNTQLSEIKESTAKGYIDSLREKYKPGQLIGDTPKNRAENLAGKKISGDHILEVPPQNNDVPKNVLDHATDRDVTIRDTNGKEYN